MTDTEIIDYLESRLKFAPGTGGFDVLIGDVPVTIFRNRPLRECLESAIMRHAGALVAAKLRGQTRPSP